MTLISAAVLLFLVMDPLGNVPMFISTLKNVPPSRQNIVIIRELLIALLLLVFFLFLGQYVLSWFHITDSALTVSGGIILFLIALRMVFPSTEKPLQEQIEGEPFIVLCGWTICDCHRHADDEPESGTLAGVAGGCGSGVAGFESDPVFCHQVAALD